MSRLISHQHWIKISRIYKQFVEYKSIHSWGRNCRVVRFFALARTEMVANEFVDVLNSTIVKRKILLMKNALEHFSIGKDFWRKIFKKSFPMFLKLRLKVKMIQVLLLGDAVYTRIAIDALHICLVYQKKKFLKTNNRR